MPALRVLGYLPELEQFLQLMCLEKFPDSMYRDDPHVDLLQERLEYRDDLIEAILNRSPLDESSEVSNYMWLMVFEAIGEDDLKGLIEFNSVDQLYIDNVGHYLAVID